MIDRRVVRRYATALFQAASKAGVVERVESDLGLVSYVLETSPALVEAVQSPVVFPDRKRAIINGIFADKIHEITLSYLYLLIDKHREEAMAQTEEEYVRLANDARGIIDVQVTTAVRMTGEEEARLKAKLEAVTGKSVHLEKIVSPEVVGGVMVRIGDTIIDGSIRGYLSALKERLMS